MVFDRRLPLGTDRPDLRSVPPRLVGGWEKDRHAKARRAARPVAVGTLVALPILTRPDGRPFDLLEAAEGKAVILLFVPADATTLVRASVAAAASCADRIAAEAAVFYIIIPRTEPAAGTTALLLDRDGGFAYSLGLADWDDERGRADLEHPVGLVLDEVGTVVVANFGGPLDLGRLIASLPKRSPSDAVRARSW